ncbi:MAG TPA: DUF4870 domain-containing protein [Ktedonobacterales bacterium]|nr:DUF4870 domain-containing protein [Ktedonobacterales bacterium]
MAIAMKGPRITRELPRVDGGTGYVRAESIARASMTISSGGMVSLFDDRVETPDGKFPLNEAFGARLCPDPRAPLTVDPPMGLGLRRAAGAWVTYMPRHEVDAVHMLGAIQQAYAARGLTLERFDVPQLPPEAPARYSTPRRAPAVTVRFDRPQRAAAQTVRLDTPPRPATPPVADDVEDLGWGPEPAWHVVDMPTPRPVWRPQVADEPLAEVTHEEALQGAEAVLLAVTHLSLLFAPVLLSAFVWFTLRTSSPRVSAQAQAALRFQALCWAVALPIVGVAMALGRSHAHAVLALLAVIFFLALLLAGAAVAFFAAVRALGGQTFNYNPLPNPYAISR